MPPKAMATTTPHPPLCERTRSAIREVHITAASPSNHIGPHGPKPIGTYCEWCAHPQDAHRADPQPPTLDAAKWRTVLEAIGTTQQFRCRRDTLMPQNALLSDAPPALYEAVMRTCTLPTDQETEEYCRDNPAPEQDRDRLGPALRDADPHRLFQAVGDMARQEVQSVPGITLALLQTEGVSFLMITLKQYVERKSAHYPIPLVDPATGKHDKAWAYAVLDEALRAQTPLMRRSPLPDGTTLLDLLRTPIDFGTPFDRSALNIRALTATAGFWALQGMRGGVMLSLRNLFVANIHKKLDDYYRSHVESDSNKLLFKAAKEREAKALIRPPPNEMTSSDRQAAATAATPSGAASNKRPRAEDLCQVQGCAGARVGDRAWCDNHVTKAQRVGTTLKATARDELHKLTKRFKRG